jgi:hypothetical protein
MSPTKSTDCIISTEKSMSNFALRFLLFALILLASLLSATAGIKTKTLVNENKETVDDLHLFFAHAAPDVTSAQFPGPPDPTPRAAGTEWDLFGGSVSQGGSATVTWKGFGNADNLTSYYWTTNNMKVGVQKDAKTALFFTRQPDGFVSIHAENSLDVAVSYTALRIFTGARQDLYTLGSYIAGMTTGQPVESFVPPSGVLPPGRTLLSRFEGALFGFTALALLVEGNLFGVGSSPVPEIGRVNVLENQVEIEVRGEPGRTYELQGTTDFVSWTRVGLEILASDPILFKDDISNYRFYQVVLR